MQDGVSDVNIASGLHERILRKRSADIFLCSDLAAPLPRDTT